MSLSLSRTRHRGNSNTNDFLVQRFFGSIDDGSVRCCRLTESWFVIPRIEIAILAFFTSFSCFSSFTEVLTRDCSIDKMVPIQESLLQRERLVFQICVLLLPKFWWWSSITVMSGWFTQGEILKSTILRHDLERSQMVP